MKTTNIWISLILALGLLLRLLTSLIGYHGDLNNNISWGTIAYEHGFNGFFEGVDWPYSAPNQPPLTILMFALARMVWQNLHNLFWYMNWELLVFPSRLVWFWDDHGMTLLVKLPSILADLGIGYLIYNYFRNSNKPKLGFSLAALWLFNPVTWYNSAVWGQTDGVVNLLGLCAIFFLVNKDLVKFSVLLTLSFLFKGSLGIFIPVLIYFVISQKYTIKHWLFSFLSSIFTIILVSVWFHPRFDLLPWLYNLYTNRILPGEIGFLSANAFNFWWLVNSGNVYDSTIYNMFPARVWGFIVTLLINAGIIFWLSKRSNEKRLIAALILVSIASFMFMTRIHERYLYPFFPLATLFLGLNPGFLAIYLLFSIIHLLNLYNLFWVPSIPFFENLLTFNWFTSTLAFTNLLLFMLVLRHLRRTTI